MTVTIAILIAISVTIAVATLGCRAIENDTHIAKLTACVQTLNIGQLTAVEQTFAHHIYGQIGQSVDDLRIGNHHRRNGIEDYIVVTLFELIDHLVELFTHQHLAEIKQNLTRVGAESPTVNFVPLRGDFTRGIFASVYTRAAEGMNEEDYRMLYTDYYAKSPFVFHSNEGISMKEVVNTNKGLVHVELHDGYVHIASAIDNLVKGAAGQAVQNMNLIFGLPEDTGLHLKPSAF